MKKQITKHFMAFFLSLVMIMAMGFTAFAADTPKYSLTVNNTGNTEHTFELYQIFTGDLSDGILSNIQWGSGVTDEGKSALGDASTVAANLKSEAEAKSFANSSLAKYLTLPTESTSVAVNGSYTFDNLTAGYYLVKDKDGTQNNGGSYTSFIMKVTGNETVSTKLGVPTVEKKVKDINDSSDSETEKWQDSADYDIGDLVPYQITGTMPSNIDSYTTYKYVFTDTMSKGLTYTEKNAKIKIGETDVTKYFNEVVAKNTDDSTTVTWTCNNLRDIERDIENVTLNKDTTVVVTYSAMLNESAAIGAAGNPNTVYLTYSNNPNDGGKGETGKTPDDKNIVFTYKVEVNKIEKINNENKPLEGAGFKLQKKVNGEYQDIKTIGPKNDKQEDITTFEFTGLDDGDYQLIESTTPAGYNTIAPIKFTISAEHSTTADEPSLTTLSGDATSGEATFTPDTTNGSLTTDVVNQKGSTLPSTGGRGTTMIYIIGAALVVTAGVVLVMRKKMNSDK